MEILRGLSFCRIAGHEIPFTQAKICELYPSHADYVAAVTASVEQLAADGFLLKADGDLLITDASARVFP
jgi:hypothetical protein